ncbi:unnamed protein product, partial [Amoebophrya sp. A25]|eukprot:GSA25T00026364001.1
MLRDACRISSLALLGFHALPTLFVRGSLSPPDEGFLSPPDRDQHDVEMDKDDSSPPTLRRLASCGSTAASSCSLYNSSTHGSPALGPV